MKVVVAVVAAAIALSACSTDIYTQQAIPDSTRQNVVVAEANASLANDVVAPSDTTAKLEQAVMTEAADHHTGNIPVKLDMTIVKYEMVSRGARFFAGALMGANEIYVKISVIDSQSGAVTGQYEVARKSNPGGYGAFYDQAEATIKSTAEGVIDGLYQKPTQ